MGVRKATTLTVLLVLTLVLFSFPQIVIVNAQSNTIYVRADGTVEGTDKIQRSGNVYVFADNINGSIIVEKNDVVIDGVNYFLQGDGSEAGIRLYDDITGITIRNLRIMNFGVGIVLSNASLYSPSLISTSYLMLGLNSVDLIRDILKKPISLVMAYL